MKEALEELEEDVLGSGQPERTGLYDSDREAAWARLGGG